MNTPRHEPAVRYGGRRRGPAWDVVVVGGGMVGAAAALAMARAGFATALVEAGAPPAWQAADEVDRRVVGLAPSAAKLFHDLGVWTSMVEARASAYQRMRVWDADTGAEIDFEATAEGWSALGWIVENRLVQWRLWQALELAGVRRLCPARVSRMQVGEDRVELTVEDSGVIDSRLLVAADGADSPLRVQAGIRTRGRDYAQRAVVAHVCTERPHEATAWQRFLPGGPLALLPLADGRSAIVWSLPKAQAQQVLALQEPDFLDALGVASDFCLGRILSSTVRESFPLKLQLAERYQADRLVLLGDAAHTVHPLAGQGVNLGLRDVAELRDTLLQARAAGRDIGAASVLRRYARRRRSANTLDALSFDALARMYAWQAPPLVAIRGAGVRLLERLAPLKRRIVAHAAGR